MAEVLASESVTVTSTVPAVWLGAVAVIDVGLSTVTVLEGTTALPKSTDAPALKFVPVMATFVPPEVGPAAGVTLVTAGVGVPKVKMSADEGAEVWMSESSTLTATVPAACAGDLTVTDVEDVATALVEVPPNVTIMIAVKFVPAILTVVPPVVGPLAGLRPVTAGVGVPYSKMSPVEVADSLPSVESIALTSTAPAGSGGADTVIVSCVFVEIVS